MSPASQWRVVLLCEDRRTERFLQGLCKRAGIRVQSTKTAPAGNGSAENWVRRQLPKEVRLLHSNNYQANLGLWAVIDSDAAGVTGRLRELGDELKSASVELDPVKDRVAFLIPAWSIETWLAALNGVAGLAETISYKIPSNEVHGAELATALRARWADEKKTLEVAVKAWNRDSPALPALARAYEETAKFGA